MDDDTKKLELRAARFADWFGGGCSSSKLIQHTTIMGPERFSRQLKRRAERFSTFGGKNGVNEMDAKRRREERFAQENLAKPVDFCEATADAEMDAKRRREERFAQDRPKTADSTKKPTKPIDSCVATADADAKRRREERFAQDSPKTHSSIKGLAKPADSCASAADVEDPKRAELIRAVFHHLDSSSKDGCLDCAEMRAFAASTGFDGSDEEWQTEWVQFCTEQGIKDMKRGVDEALFKQLVSDNSTNGQYCTDEELRELLSTIPGELAASMRQAQTAVVSTRGPQVERASEVEMRRMRMERFSQVPSVAAIGIASEADMKRKRMERFAQPPGIVTGGCGAADISLSPIKAIDENARLKMRAERFANVCASPSVKSEAQTEEVMRLKRMERFAVR